MCAGIGVALLIGVVPQLKNRRQDPRFKVRYPVTVHSDGVKQHGRTIDLSCSGARIATICDRVAPPEGPVRVQIGPLELLGVTAWTSKANYGVRFLIMSDVERLTLAELLDEGLARRLRLGSAA